MESNDCFEGFVVSSHEKWQEFSKQPLKAKQFGDRDVDIEIECCGVCGSDVHTITGGWGSVPLPLCVGHEIVGHAVRVGKDVTTVKLGDRVGVGAQIWACLDCPQCKSDNENYCPHMVDTYGSQYPESVDPNKTISQGGFASHIRAHEYFVFKIPDEIPSHMAAPMLCAGLTVWSPLVRASIGPGKTLAVVGLGGLGHFAVMWGTALGAEVSVISHSPSKKADALNLGAKRFIISNDPDWHKPYAFAFDMVLNTANMTQNFNIPEYLSLCKVNGSFHQVGLPNDPLPPFRTQAFMPNGSSIGASHIGSRQECLAMLDFAARRRLLPRVETIPISEEGCKTATTKVKDGSAKYRITLTDFDKAFRMPK
ncbi:uncharacterized protein Z520_00836 [Fonsecaea multimorphosa CBS 102226]|uniref:Enoyl reductase (ER) domain-containing protein n=1 Tax=Fonsecaea multimorphosa CBS 102226 TaxID=1442371 RepID=A0A0D2L4Z1_9EURO|nr:uncharacterized protein Z520_00836 [Fonsecaea multimorphosa CBS 102226]KIY04144.1 hypothetical protein Z520_00836 [Fonsecaea multimorphosa CBS 102226]OAL31974.1 hypothetical protein AYO22_00844 [Fonsecaea multimorphosa]